MKLLVTAMEPSSNLHLKAISKHIKNCQYLGIFDKSLGTPLYDPREFSVMGIIDVIKKISKAKKAIKELVLLAKDAHKIVLIDAPAFNLPLAKALKKRYPNKEIIYYILPKVWAWKSNRIFKVMRYTNKQLSIFPFENRYYPNSVYVGNPLMDEITQYKEKVTNNNTIIFLPGSRNREIKSLMPLFHKVREQLLNQKALLVIPDNFDNEKIRDLYGDTSTFEIVRNMHKAVYKADYAFVCSGTATLETALIGTPLALVYATNKIEYKIARTFVKLPFVGLANLIFWFESMPIIHKEFLQKEATVLNLLKAYEEDNRDAFLKKSKILRKMLTNGCNEKVAKVITNDIIK